MHLTQGLHRAAQIKPNAVATIFGDGGGPGARSGTASRVWRRGWSRWA